MTEKMNNLVIENARLAFKNFAGKGETSTTKAIVISVFFLIAILQNSLRGMAGMLSI